MVQMSKIFLKILKDKTHHLIFMKKKPWFFNVKKKPTKEDFEKAEVDPFTKWMAENTYLDLKKLLLALTPEECNYLLKNREKFNVEGMIPLLEKLTLKQNTPQQFNIIIPKIGDKTFDYIPYHGMNKANIFYLFLCELEKQGTKNLENLLQNEENPDKYDNDVKTNENKDIIVKVLKGEINPEEKKESIIPSEGEKKKSKKKNKEDE